MKTTSAIPLALAGYGMAQNATYACNPAHSYPGGASCISTAGTLSLVYPTASAAPVNCQTQYDACRVAPEANMAACAAQYAGCLGYNPFAPNGTNTATDSYTTEVVTAYTTYCPNPTTVVPGNGKTYTVSSATTLTITDCPCTISKPVSSMPTPYFPANTTMMPQPTAPAYTTSVVSALTTYCPTPTTFTVDTSLTYTVSTPTTITISSCPAGGCTISVPVSTPTSYGTATGPAGSTPSSTVPVFAGAGSKTSLVAGSAFFGLFGAVAALL